MVKKLLVFLFAALFFLLTGIKAHAQAITYSSATYTLTTGLAANITPTAVTPPAAGTWTVVVSIAPALSNGTLAIAAATGVISGTPSTVAAAVPYTVTATFTRTSNGNIKTATAGITITVVAPPVFSYTTPQTYTQGTAITALSPAITSGGPLTGATISPALPTGLSMSAAGVISGTPTAASAATSYTITAIGAAGGTGTAALTITVNPAAPSITYTTPQTYTANVAIATLNPTNSGGTATYTTTGLPAGLALNASTGAITGTPTTLAGIAAANYSITATNVTGTSTFSINITINQAAPIITYTTPDTFPAGVAITPLTVTNTGGSVTTYTTTGLPAGLALDPVAGTISGTPTTIAGIAAANYSVTATNSTGSSTFPINITIGPELPAFTYPTPDTFTAGVAITAIIPTNTGGPVTTYSATSGPPGLALNASTGAITGTPTTLAGIAATNYTITATNASGTSTFIINITINPAAPAITYTTPETYTAGTAIATLSPTNTGGPVTTYTTTGLPAGLSLNAATGAITGTPTTLAGIAAASYSVMTTNSTGSSTFSITITINPEAPAITYTTPDTFVAGVAIAGLNPTNTGGPVTTYTTTGLPAGLTLDATTGAITGTPTTVAGIGATTYHVTATNATGASTTNIRITITEAAPNITYTTPDTYTAGTAIATLSPTNTGGNNAVTYAVTGTALPAGLTLSTTTGAITGTPTTLAGIAATNYSVTATNVNGTSTAIINITINAAAPAITYTTPDTYTAGTAIATLSPTNTGGPVTTYTTTGLPAGLSLNAATGAITGTPTTIAGIAAASYSVTATNSTGTSTFSINITINPEAPAITYTTPDTFVAGVAIAGLNPTNTGGPVNTYTTTGLPAGLTLNASTGSITGTPTTVAGIGATTYHVTATNATGTSTTNIRITITEAAPNITYTTPDTYTAGTAIATLSPTNTGGPTAVTYAVTGTALPAGLTLNTTTGAITGTPTTLAGIAVTNYSVTATNVNGTSTATINITINPAAPAITYTTPDTYTAGVAITTLNPTNTGGPITTYTTTGLPAGLTLNATTGAITGTPTTVAGIAATNYSVTATNATGSSTATINITIIEAAPNITYTTPDTYTAGTAIATLSPTNTGGTTAVTYAVVGTALPAGLSLNTTTGAITGTPTTYAGIAATNYTIKATNVSGSSTFAINITIVALLAPAITYTTPDVYTAGAVIATLSPTNAGGAATYTTTGLPAGLAINATTGAITGTPTTVAGIPATNYGVTATNAAGSSTFSINITIDPAAPVIAYTTPDTYTAGVAITPLTPTNTGGVVTTYTTLGLPAGLSLNSTTGVITGTPTTLAGIGIKSYRVTATNSSGSMTAIIRIAINPAIPAITYPTPDTYSAGVAITTLSPTDTGGPVTTYTTTGLPAGLTLNATTGAITGTPTTSAGIAATNYSVTATNTSGSNTFQVNITISPIPAPVIAYPTPDTYTAGVAIATLSPTNTGGAAASYSTTGLPAGLTLNTTTGAITGTPTTTAGIAATNYSVTATNAGGTSTFLINITIDVALPAITYTSPDTFTANVAITTLNPANTGGAVASYTTTGLPAGLALNATTGAITGTPTTTAGIAATNYYVTATNVSGSSIATIDITINPIAPAITYTTPDVYTAGTTITPLSPTNTGGPATTYTTTGLPPGLTLNATTGLITGKPRTAAGIAATNYSVTATNVTGSSTFLINITIDPLAEAPNITYTTPEVYTAGTAIAKLKPTNTGGGKVTYTTTGLPAGLALNSASGAITGTPTTAAGIAATNYSVTATNAVGSSTFLINITINATAPSLTYATPEIYVVGTAFTLTPINVGGAFSGTSIAPALPSGVTLSTAGVISGASTVTSAPTSYVVTATYASGTVTSNSFSLTFVTPPAISYTPSTNAYTAGIAITPLTPANTGGTVGAPGFASTTISAILTGPQGVTIGPTGNIYVANSGFGLIDEYSSAEAFIGAFGTVAGAFTGFNNPVGIVFDSSGNAYVLDNGTGVVYKFNSSGTYVATLNPLGGAGFTSGFGIAIDASNNLYVSENGNGDVYKFTTAGVLSQTITLPAGSAPTEIVTDASGNFYVADNGNGAVYKYSSTGTLTATLITGLNTPDGLAIDATGNLYVGDSGTGLVSEYTSTGTLITSITGQTDPEGLAVDGSGNVYVSDATNGTLTSYAKSGGYYLTGTLPAGLSFNTTTGVFSGTPTTAFASITYSITAYNVAGNSTTTVTLSCTVTPPAFDYSPSTNVYTVGTAITPLVPVVTSGTIGPPGFGAGTTISATLNGPQSVTINSSGNIYVANSSAGLVDEYSSAGAFIGTFGTPSGAFTGFTNPVGIVFDTSGNAYVLDSGTGRVYKFTSTGTYLATLNPLGGNGFKSGFGIAIDPSNNIYVSEAGNGNVYKFSTTGLLSQAIAVPGGSPAELVTDASGNLYVLGNGNGAVYEYGTTGTLVAKLVTGLNNPYGLAINASDDLFVGDSGTGLVSEYSSTGTLLTSISGLIDPEGLAVDGSGNVYVSDATNGTLIEYQTIGGYYLTGTLPAGLSFNTTTGTFSGTPSTVFGPTTYTVTAYSYGLSATTTVTLSCTLPAPAISYTPSTDVYCVGTAITALSPVNTGGPVSAMTFNVGASITGGTLSSPYGIATDPSGNVYVTNSGNGTINKYTAAGVYSSVFATGLTTPVGIVFDASGNAYVIDRGTNDVYKITPGGVRTVLISGITNLRGIAISAAGNLYGTRNPGNQIAEYTTAGALVTTFPSTYTTAPSGIAVSSSGNVYVLDHSDNNIVEFTTSGAYVQTFASGFNAAYGLSVDAAGNVYVADSGNDKIEVYNSLGTLLTTITSGLNGPYGVTTDTQGDVLVSNYSGNTVYEYTVTGNYTISPALPAGLAFNTVTGAITGTPTANSAATVYTVGCNNTTGAATTTVTVTTTTAPTITYTTPDVYTTGTAVTLAPTVVGIPTTYSVSPALPAGLSINTTTGVIDGVPTVITAAAPYVVTATNSCGVSTFTVNITINPPAPVITCTTPDVYDIGTAITALTPNNTGGTVVTWAISPALPAGLSFDVTTGIISGTPTALSAATNYTVSATNAGGTGTFVINITVIEEAPVIAYTTPDSFPVGSLITPQAPANTGGPPTSYAVSPGLPAGLNFDTTTGVITGTPTAVSAAANYTVTATNSGGTGTFVISIACVSAGPILSYATPDVFPVGTAIAPISPVNTGTTPVSYGISPGLPTGLNFDTTTGIISGTPTVTSAATTYNVTATDASSNTGTATIVIACSGYVDWIGVTSNDWNTPTNWATGAVPMATDIAGIGVNQTFLNFPNLGPSGAATNSVAAVVIGSSSTQVTAGTSATAQAGGFVVNAGSTLNVSGSITYQSDANAGTLAATISGPGTVYAGGINVTANTTLGAAYTETLSSSVSSLNISSDITLNSSDNAGTAFNSTFSITGGIVALTGVVTTTNTAAATSTLAVLPTTTATLQFANTSAFSGLSATGTNVFNVNNAGATIEYSGATQTYYTDAAITGLGTGVQYHSLKFSGSGLKSPNGSATNNVFVAGDFTNALTVNDASDYIDFSEPTVIFNGASQNIYAGNGTGTVFNNVTFNGNGTTTIQNGAAYVDDIGTLTIGGTATLAAGGYLTLISDATGSAAVAPIPSGCSVTGTVNVQRYISGKRGYRLMSSPVNAGTSGSGPYSMNYLLNNLYLTGSGAGFTATGNPTLFLYDEGFVPAYATYYDSNFIAVSSMSTGTGMTPTYPVNVNGAGLTASYTVPAGNGYYVFFRGNLTEGTANLTTPSYSGVLPATVTASGTLNQGSIPFADWYSPSSTFLGGASQNYNLVGNPYASAIDLATVQGTTTTTGIYMTPYAGSTGITHFVYQLDPVTNIYAIYNLANPALSTNNASEFIASGQAFFVQAFGTNTSQLIFNESAKATSTNASAPGFMDKRVNNLAGINTGTPDPVLRLKMSLDSIHHEETVINFDPKASTAFVINEDAPHRQGEGLIGFTSISSDNIPLGINMLPLAATQTIPLRTVATNDGLYNITLARLANLPALYEIWLKDAYMKDSLDIKDNPTYNFNITHADTSTYGNYRFTLVIRQNPALMVHLLSFTALKATGGDNVAWTTENEANYTGFAVQRSTDGGKTFATLDALVSSGLGAYSYLDKTPVQGANSYRLQLTDLNGNISYSNVITIMYANTGNQIALNGFMVYPNPTAAALNLSITQPTATTTASATISAAYTIQIVNNLGVVLKTAQSSSPQWQTDVSALVPGTYIITVKNTTDNTLVGRSAFVKL